VAEVVERQPNKCETLSSNPCSTKKKKKEKQLLGKKIEKENIT
jgi:hypothetical protein